MQIIRFEYSVFPGFRLATPFLQIYCFFLSCVFEPGWLATTPPRCFSRHFRAHSSQVLLTALSFPAISCMLCVSQLSFLLSQLSCYHSLYQCSLCHNKLLIYFCFSHLNRNSYDKGERLYINSQSYKMYTILFPLSTPGFPRDRPFFCLEDLLWRLVS